MCSFYLIINLNLSFFPFQTLRILHLAGDWIDIFHETYCRVDSCQHTDLEKGKESGYTAV